MQLAITPGLPPPDQGEPDRWFPWPRKKPPPAPPALPSSPAHEDAVRQLDERLSRVERKTEEIDQLIQAELRMHRRKTGDT